MHKTKEIWKPAIGCPLMVSSLGRIMSPVKVGTMPNGGQRTYGGKPWRGVWEKEERRRIVVKSGKTYKIARLVCEAFHGPPPEDKPCAIHKDENSDNNKADNLKWGTLRERLNAPKHIDYCKSRTGENSPTRKAKRKREAA